MLIRQYKPTDQRKSKRHQLLYYLEVYDRETGQFVGHLVDLSSEGAMLISKNCISPGTRIHLRIALSPISYNQQDIDIQAQSVRSGQDINADYYNIGLHFIDASDQSKAVIEHLIDNYGF